MFRVYTPDLLLKSVSIDPVSGISLGQQSDTMYEIARESRHDVREGR